MARNDQLLEVAETIATVAVQLLNYCDKRKVGDIAEVANVGFHLSRIAEDLRTLAAKGVGTSAS